MKNVYEQETTKTNNMDECFYMILGFSVCRRFNTFDAVRHYKYLMRNLHSDKVKPEEEEWMDRMSGFVKKAKHVLCTVKLKRDYDMSTESSTIEKNPLLHHECSAYRAAIQWLSDNIHTWPKAPNTVSYVNSMECKEPIPEKPPTGPRRKQTPKKRQLDIRELLKGKPDSGCSSMNWRKAPDGPPELVEISDSDTECCYSQPIGPMPEFELGKTSPIKEAVGEQQSNSDTSDDIGDNLALSSGNQAQEVQAQQSSRAPATGDEADEIEQNQEPISSQPVDPESKLVQIDKTSSPKKTQKQLAKLDTVDDNEPKPGSSRNSDISSEQEPSSMISSAKTYRITLIKIVNHKTKRSKMSPTGHVTVFNVLWGPWEIYREETLEYMVTNHKEEVRKFVDDIRAKRKKSFHALLDHVPGIMDMIH